MATNKTTWSRATIFNRLGAKRCDICGHKFEPREEFAVGETKVSWFRGDDEVGFLCKDCVTPDVAKRIKLK